MRKFLLLSAVSVCVAGLLVIESCKKETTDGIVEPITINKPDSLIARQYAGDLQKINITFTTDRPINNVTCMYQVDSSHTANFNYTYPDTLFAVRLDSAGMQLSNKYTWNGTYRVSDSLHSLDVIRFRVRMKASGNPSNRDTVREEKQFKIVVQ